MLFLLILCYQNFVASTERPASPAAHPRLPRQRRRASCRLVNAIVKLDLFYSVILGYCLELTLFLPE